MQSISSINVNSDIFSSSINNNPIKPVENSDKVNSSIKFDEVIEEAINKVNESQVTANNKVEALIKGEDVTMHEVMLSMQESQMSMQLMLEVRNKLYEAYQEVNRVQL